MKILEYKRQRIFDVGFIDPYVVNFAMVKDFPKNTKANLLMFLKKQDYKKKILFPYNFKWEF